MAGNRIPPDQYDSFQFIARNPVREGELEWKVIQRYTDATDRWIGPPDSENPAARTTISETATPVDAINTEEGTPGNRTGFGRARATGRPRPRAGRRMAAGQRHARHSGRIRGVEGLGALIALVLSYRDAAAKDLM